MKLIQGISLLVFLGFCIHSHACDNGESEDPYGFDSKTTGAQSSKNNAKSSRGLSDKSSRNKEIKGSSSRSGTKQSDSRSGKKQSSSRSSQKQSSSRGGKESVTGSIKHELFDKVMNIFKVDLSESQSFFETKFNISSFKFIGGSDLKSSKQGQRFVSTMKTKDGRQTIAVKLERKKNARSEYDAHTETISCITKGQYKKDKNKIMTEEKINQLMMGERFFIKYFKDLSGTIQSADGEIQSYAYEYMDGSMDLKYWSKKNRKNMKKIEYESTLMRIFAGIYIALEKLLDKGFVYTDLKPANILLSKIGTEPYLIDLESVIDKKSFKNENDLCFLQTAIYFPPDYNAVKLLTASQLKNRKSSVHKKLARKPANPDRILSWTFCISIYEAMCGFANVQEIMKSYDSWDKNQKFLDIYKCTNEPSRDLTAFLNTCLTKEAVPGSFKNLRPMAWIKYDLTLIV